jgi:hypothetical protein
VIQPENQNDLLGRKNDLSKLLQESGQSLVKIHGDKFVLERELT